LRTQVAIVGAGPAGLFLAHLLHRHGIEVRVLERRSRSYVEGRVRAGVLEQSTADLMAELGLGARLQREGLVHDRTSIACDGEVLRIDFGTLVGGRSVIVYGQQEVMKDLFDSASKRGIDIAFEVEDVEIRDVDSDHPSVIYSNDGRQTRMDCDFIAGCDGSHGASRGVIPASLLRVFERVYPFGWLGILADVPPLDELIYCNHERGFALASMRSRSRSRYYLQCPLDENLDAWSDDRFWDELSLRLGPQIAAGLTRGASFEKSIAPLRSFVAEPMQYGRLFLAGDAAHIVPPTGAKGLNLAVADVKALSDAISAFYRTGSREQLDGYSAKALARVWKAERFSWWFTKLTHRFPDMDGFDRRIQIAEFDYLRNSRAARTALAENYVGLPLD